MDKMICMYIIFYVTALIHTGTPAQGTPTYRLADGMYDSEGRVEVLFTDSTWASFCDGLWEIEEASVICNYLNYTGADRALLAGYFGEVRNGSSGPAYGGLTCTGFEDHLLQCNNSGVGSLCPHSGKGAGVMCTSHGSLRLANGSVPGEGRVEILGEFGDWGTICDDGWDLIDAGVACRQIGYPDALEALVNEDPYDTQPVFGPGSGPVFLDELSCWGYERHLRDCPVEKEWGIHDCTHSEDAGVRCDTRLIRLQDGEYSNEGRVEIYHGGSWGTICSWTFDAAHVACRELGFPLGALEILSVDGGDERVLLDEVTCLGNESHVGDCESLGWAKVHNCFPYPRDNQLTAGVICNDPANVVRLLSGSTSYEGVVQYRYISEPGFICDPDWSDKEAEVVCRQQGYQYGRSEKTVSLGLLFSGTIYYHDYQCNGTEKHLGDCHFSPFSDYECDPINHIAQVKCGPPNEFDLRLMGSDYTEQGRVDVYLNNEWSSITDDYFTSYDRQTVCRQLGYEGAAYYSSSYNLFDSGSGRIAIDDLNCYNSHYKITECDITFSGNESTNTRNDELEVICIPYVSVANHPVRLINEWGEINREYGRVEIFHDDHWGSVCDDYFYYAELICTELGHDATHARSLEPTSYNIPNPDRVWFSLIECNSFAPVVQYLFQCRFSPWGYVDESWCWSGRDVGVQCIENLPLTLTTEATLRTHSTSPSIPILTRWEIFLIAIAFIVPLLCVICCCYHRNRPKRTDTPSNVVYTSSANNEAGSVTVASPPPCYVPSSPSPTEQPPSYDSVIQSTNQTDPPTESVNPSDDVTTSHANQITSTNVSNVETHSDSMSTHMTQDNGTCDVINVSEVITPKNSHDDNEIIMSTEASF